MKSKIIFIVILSAILLYSNDTKSMYNYHSYKLFYSSLKPYGEWIEIDDGIIAWRPVAVRINWKPYLIGRWCWTKHGWYWDSYEPFGWAVYHYGRWFYDDYYGWIWIPDDQWGPAWVEWRYDDFYIGWAPLPPYAFFRIDIGIHFSINWHSHYSYWNFVPFNHFCDHHVHYFVLDSRRSYKIFERTKYRNNYSYRDGRIINDGIDRSVIERKARIRIREYDINDVDDYKKIERIRDRDNNRIYTYRFSDKDYETLTRNRDSELRKVERRSSLQRDKIIMQDNDNVKSYDNRTIERNRTENEFKEQRSRSNEFYDNRKNKEPETNHFIPKRGERGETRRELIEKNNYRERNNSIQEKRDRFENRDNSDNSRLMRRRRE